MLEHLGADGEVEGTVTERKAVPGKHHGGQRLRAPRPPASALGQGLLGDIGRDNVTSMARQGVQIGPSSRPEIERRLGLSAA